MASIHASEATLVAMKAPFPHVVLCFIHPRSTSYLQCCIQTQATTTLARSVVDGSLDVIVMKRGTAATVFGRMGVTRHHKTRRDAQVGVRCVPTAMPTSKKASRRPRHSMPTMSSSPSTSSRSPLPKTPWNGPGPSQTHRLSPS